MEGHHLQAKPTTNSEQGQEASAWFSASSAAAVTREELVENGLQRLIHPGWGTVVQVTATGWAAEHLGPEGPVQAVLHET